MIEKFEGAAEQKSESWLACDCGVSALKN